MIAPDLADKVIPNLTADDAFDRDVVQPARARVPRALATRHGGPTFTTLPWKMGDAVGSFLTVKQPDADQVLAILRGEAPIPDHDHGRARLVRPAPARVRRHHGAGRAASRRAGAGAQRLRGAERAAGNTAQAFAGKGFVGRHGNDSRGTIDKTEIRYATSDRAKAPLLATYVPDAQLVPDTSLSGTDVVLVVGKSFRGLGSGATATTGAPAPTPTTLSPEAACQ